jgi:hypothetical protein
MKTNAPAWIRLLIGPSVEEGVAITPQGSRGDGGVVQILTSSLTELEDFTAKIGDDAAAHAALDDQTLAKARELFEDVFRGNALALSADYVGRVRPGRLLVRLAISSPRLQGIAWEAMHTPRGGALDTNGSLAASPCLHVVRDVSGGGPARALRVLGPVRVLVLATAAPGVIQGIDTALAHAVDTGAIERLDVIPEAQVATLADLRKALQLRSAPGQRPHILHIVGHGSVANAAGTSELKPVLALPGEPEPIPVQTIADDLASFFSPDLRLVVLDACWGAAPGATGSAAEILARRAAVAVVAHLWPLDPLVARAVAKSFYTSLTEWEQARGDVAASLTSARSELAAKGAGAFSPVLYLRGESPLLFDFRGRTRPPPEPPPGGETDEALDRILRRPFSLVLGDPGEDPLNWHTALLRKIAGELQVNEGELTSVRAAIERCVLVKGRQRIEGLFKDVFDTLLKENDAPVTSLAWELARGLAPGVHATLLWLPHLEHAVAERHPDSNVYVVQPESTSLWARWRATGSDDWTVPDEGWSTALDLTRDYVILRPYGGILPVLTVMGTLLTEEDHAVNPRSADMPAGWDDLLDQLHVRPSLAAGVSIFDWHHRMVLRRLFDTRLPANSVVVLPPDAEKLERRAWDERGGGLNEFSRDRQHVDVVLHSPSSLARKVARFSS